MNRRSWRRSLGVAVVIVAAPIAAHAQDAAPPIDDVASGLRPASGFGVEFLVGGGYSNFTGSTARSLTTGAGTWDIRLVFGSRQPIGLELAYVGSAQDFDEAGLGPGAYLLGNGAEAAFRLGVPVQVKSWLIGPFASAGLGWNYYSQQNSNLDTSTVAAHDGNFTVPLAVGIDGIYQAFTINVRGSYRPTYDNDLFGGASLATWGVSGNLGFEF
jgi:hypothetical protein